MRPRGVLALLALAALPGCADDDAGPVAGGLAAADYHGLGAGRAWTWTDGSGEAGDTGEASGEVDEDSLVRGRNDEGDTIELRRGARWADATPAGALELDTSDGIAIQGWDIAGLAGSRELRLVDGAPEEGDRHTSGRWTCVTSTHAEVETFYGTFDDVLRVDCERDDGDRHFPGGFWTFARGAGLVKVVNRDFTLELVAPW